MNSQLADWMAQVELDAKKKYLPRINKLEKQLEKAEGVIKNMMDHQASSIGGNIPVARLSTVYRIGENYFKEKDE